MASTKPEVGLNSMAHLSSCQLTQRRSMKARLVQAQSFSNRWEGGDGDLKIVLVEASTKGYIIGRNACPLPWHPLRDGVRGLRARAALPSPGPAVKFGPL